MLAAVIALLSVVIPILLWMIDGTDRMRQALEIRIGGVETRLDTVITRLDETNSRINRTNKRLDTLSERLDTLREDHRDLHAEILKLKDTKHPFQF